jgi:hypothetical protein
MSAPAITLQQRKKGFGDWLARKGARAAHKQLSHDNFNTRSALVTRRKNQARKKNANLRTVTTQKRAST